MTVPTVEIQTTTGHTIHAVRTDGRGYCGRRLTGAVRTNPRGAVSCNRCGDILDAQLDTPRAPRAVELFQPGARQDREDRAADAAASVVLADPVTGNEVELPREDELEAAIERADERYLIEWVAEHPTTIEQARAGIARFFDRIGEL